MAGYVNHYANSIYNLLLLILAKCKSVVSFHVMSSIVGANNRILASSSLVPGRGGGGGETAPGLHCLCMRLIIAKAMWQN